MLKRTITGALIAITVYVTVYFSHIPEVIYGYTAILCIFAVYEIFRSTDMLKNKSFFALTILIETVIVFLKIPHYTEIVSTAFIVAVFVSMLLMLIKDRLQLNNLCSTAFITLLIVLLFKAIPMLRELKNGLWYLTFGVTICFTTDIFAYLIGRFWGRHKLIPSISPNKTVEGALAGVVFSVLIATIGGILLDHSIKLQINYLLLAAYAFTASLMGQLGDLSMSAIKRICNIKDFGNILPGHGGILDRFDSHLFVIPFTYLFCIITGGFVK